MYTAAEKLEQLISETHLQREAYCFNPAEDILKEAETKVILDAWKADYTDWMHPEKLETTWSMSSQQWHSCLRRHGLDEGNGMEHLWRESDERQLPDRSQ